MDQPLDIRPPEGVQHMLAALHSAGFEACLVGGCVRDALLGLPPSDWDITTAARPEQMRPVLESAGMQVYDTGLRHGTLLATGRGAQAELTTFRVDGPYRDGRRPEQVRFTQSLEADLLRRDFTINAMAWRDGELVDPAGGRADLAARCIRAVGVPQVRFGEDGLRLLRGLRLSARLGFDVETETARAMSACAHRLSRVSGERIQSELMGLLGAPHCARVMARHVDVLAAVLPELLPCVGFDQRNHHHIYDVWQHTLAALDAARPEPLLRLVLLLHDLGKPSTFSVDAQGTGHFYGHGAAGVRLAEGILDRLRFDGETRRRVLTLIRYHDSDLLATPKSIRRWLLKLGEDDLRLLIAVKRADNLAQNPKYSRQAALDEAEAVLDAVLAQGQCFSLRQLAVDGHDMAALGARGPEIGAALAALLEAVIDERCPNERAELLALAKTLM